MSPRPLQAMASLLASLCVVCSGAPRYVVVRQSHGRHVALARQPAGRSWHSRWSRLRGRKGKWISPWLVATYDPRDGTLGSVCRVMSGFSDAFYKENTVRYMGAEFGFGSGA